MLRKAGKSRFLIHQTQRIKVNSIDDTVIGSAALDNIIIGPGLQPIPAVNDKMEPVPVACRKKQIAKLLNDRLLYILDKSKKEETCR